MKGVDGMPWVKSTRTAKEKQNWHAQQSKKGATVINKKTGKAVPLSDFARGRHYQKAVDIGQARAACARRNGVSYDKTKRRKNN